VDPPAEGRKRHTQVNYTYWPNNLLKTETDPFDDPAAPHHVVAYDYDKEGRQILRQDKFDNVEQRRTESVYKPDGTTRFQTSTGTGLPTHRSFFDYDAANNLTLVKTADNYNGVPESPVDPNVSQIVNAYTTQGQLEKVEETIYPPAGGTPVAKTSLFEWERDGVIGRHTVDGQASEFDHRLDRMETRFDPFNGAEDFTASWSDSGDLNQLTLPNGAKIDQAYDGAARLIDRTVKVGTTTMSGWTDISYDDNDNRLGEQVSQRKLDGSGVRSGTSGYGYDQLDRLIRNRHGFDQGTAAVALQAGQRRQRPGRVGGVGQRLGDPGLCRHQLRLHQQPPGF